MQSLGLQHKLEINFYFSVSSPITDCILTYLTLTLSLLDWPKPATLLFYSVKHQTSLLIKGVLLWQLTGPPKLCKVNHCKRCIQIDLPWHSCMFHQCKLTYCSSELQADLQQLQQSFHLVCWCSRPNQRYSGISCVASCTGEHRGNHWHQQVLLNFEEPKVHSLEV